MFYTLLMATNNLLIAQVRISNVAHIQLGVTSAKVLCIKASCLKDYIDQIRNEANKRSAPNTAQQFAYLPLLSVWDAADTGEEVMFDKAEDLPKETVLNSKGDPILVILPEDHPISLTVNAL